ncbi:VWA domain-containing protein [Neorhodopirellula pilleata]|uniref:von Willebrand factor type A domain protein n=1 Tax=Neorhodopirellula pilleata TaxID=2714738 RepID=A0A5C6AI77_9BACT|nr:VWA domain-containing protein [Neorhodopirellula pilleata]TWT98875.1 von Willebrand factor type A domain protein [Neorhodopirellula pilleata]
MNLDEGIQIGNADAVVWLVVAVVVVSAWAIANGFRRRARVRFATGDRVNDVFQLHGRTKIASRVRATLSVLAIVLLTLGLMDWRWGKTRREVPQKGIEIMFLLDVSRSMLAQDATPSRLERAKQMIRDMVGAMAGDRVGLVAFAGETRRIIPLTNHYEDFITTLADVGPDSLRRGGSRLGDAIEAGGDGFLSKTNSYRVMIVLTDGEDQESEPVKMAQQLYQQEGIRVFTIGLGDMSAGAKIPDEETQHYVRYQGEPVVTKLNGEILEQVARVSDGAYVPAGIKQVDMKAVYDRYIAGIEKTDFDTVKIDAYEARFQWFAFPALMLLLTETLMTGRRSGRRSGRVAAAIMLVLTWSTVGNDVAAQAMPTDAVADEYSIYNQGVAAYQNDDLETAIGLFDQTAGAVDLRIAAAARYNAGTARVAQAAAAIQEGQTEGVREDLTAAVASLRSALRLRPRWEDARANLERAVRLLDQLSSQQQQQQQDQQQEPKSDQSDPSDQSNPTDPSDPSGEEQQDPKNQPAAEPTPDASENNGEQDNQGADESDNEGSSEGEPQAPSEPQAPADPQGELESDKSADQSQPNANQPGEATESIQPAEPAEMTEEEAQKMLQAVRDRDMIRRFRQQQLNRMRQVPVDKDW